MPDEADFIRAVIAKPDDDAPRLVYADWLLENGQDERAEFIRVQCAMEAIPGTTTIFKENPDITKMAALRRRERELWLDGRAYWTADFPGPLGDATNELSWWQRGFVEAVTCTGPDWLAHGNAIVAAQPVREVTLTTWPESWGPYNTRPTAEEWLRTRWPSVKTWHLPSAMRTAEEMNAGLARGHFHDDYPADDLPG